MQQRHNHQQSEILTQVTGIQPCLMHASTTERHDTEDLVFEKFSHDKNRVFF